MSYNISNWKTKELEDFKVPLSELIALPYTTVAFTDIGRVRATGMTEDFEVSGKLIDDMIEVEEIYLVDEGSGAAWNRFEDMLTASSGYLSALLVWGNGRSISTLEVRDGLVVQNELEL